MTKKKRKPKAQPQVPGPRGPEPELLKIDIGWKDAVKKSLEKKKPATGWPK